MELIFQPRQIVYLEDKHSRLYAEVIQVVESRRVCWVRPMMLVAPINTAAFEQLVSVTDLRSSADVLLPSTLFQSALDTDVMPLLVHLTREPQLDRDPVALTQLNQFIRQLWQAHQDRDHRWNE